LWCSYASRHKETRNIGHLGAGCPTSPLATRRDAGYRRCWHGHAMVADLDGGGVHNTLRIIQRSGMELVALALLQHLCDTQQHIHGDDWRHHSNIQIPSAVTDGRIADKEDSYCRVQTKPHLPGGLVGHHPNLYIFI